MNDSPSVVRLKVWADGACFTRPEMKVERVSYETMTPAAARGVLEAILWKPEMRWQVTAIDVLKPIRFAQIRRNEVSARASARSPILIEQKREQRAMLYLADVAYVIHAKILRTEKAEPEDTVAKYAAIFMRRASRGKCHAQPYLGTREFSAGFSIIPGDAPDPPRIPESRDLGFLFYDFDYAIRPPRPRFFRARLQAGRLVVPPPDDPEVLS